MEDNGNHNDFLNELIFNYQKLEVVLTPPINLYNGRGPPLCHGVARQFDIALECVSVCGGMGYNVFKQVTTNSNSYARMNMIDSGYVGGSPLSNISVQEMVQYHGVVLKMSVDHRELGGYVPYITEPYSVNSSRNYGLLTNYPAWALKLMPLHQFK